MSSRGVVYFLFRLIIIQHSQRSSVVVGVDSITARIFMRSSFCSSFFSPFFFTLSIARWVPRRTRTTNTGWGYLLCTVKWCAFFASSVSHQHNFLQEVNLQRSLLPLIHHIISLNHSWFVRWRFTGDREHQQHRHLASSVRQARHGHGCGRSLPRCAA